MRQDVRTLRSLAAHTARPEVASPVTDLFSRPSPAGPESIPVPMLDGAPLLPCLYCRHGVPADSFAFWSHARRLVSATCPACERRVTLTAATWHAWSSQDLTTNDHSNWSTP